MSSRVPLRDKQTWISYFQVTSYGWFLFGFGPCLQFLREDLLLSGTLTSLHSVAMALGAVLVGSTSSKVIPKIGRGKFLRLASYSLVIGLVLFTGGQVLAVTLLGVAFIAAGGAAGVQGTGAFLNNHQGLAAPAAITELNALAAGVGLLAPIFIGAGYALGFGWRPGILIAGVMAIGVELMRGKDVQSYGPPVGDIEQSHHHDLPGSLPKSFNWALVVLICTAGTEFSMLLFGSELLREQGNLTKGAAAIALACIVGGMFLGRLYGSRLATRMDPELLYRGVLIWALVGFLIFWLARNPTVMILALVFTGCGMSLHWPFGMARAVRASAGRPDRATALVSVGSGIASGAAPFALGALSDHVGVHNAYGIVPILLAIAITISIFKRVPALEGA